MADLTRPGIVLRIAVAGNRAIPGGTEAELSTRIGAVFAAIEAAILSLSPNAGAAEDSMAYSDRAPTLRLISGLADGGDQIASEAFLASRSDKVERALAAVLPFDVDTYRDRSPIDNLARFKQQLAACRYVLELDGRYSDGDDSKAARAAAYRAQSEVLLRHADILLAVEDSRADAKAGGTRESMTRALYSGVPVIYISLKENRTTVLRSADAFDKGSSGDEWRTDLAQIVHAILADPRALAPEAVVPALSKREEQDRLDRRLYENDLVREFFSESVRPSSFRQSLWTRFERRFRHRHGPSLGFDAIPAVFQEWRSKASALSAYYAGLYRGTFLLNYSLAALAVWLAVAAFVALAVFPGTHWLAVVLAACELAAVVTIQHLTMQANRSRWNDKAVAYRYLAERLRAMAYLPPAGSLRALPPGSGGYTTRVTTRSVVDWLFQAMVRYVSLEAVTPPAESNKLIRLNPGNAAVAVRDAWLANQARYHDRNATTMGRMSHVLERWGKATNITVIVVVSTELLTQLLTGPHILPVAFAHALSPWLLFLAAALPAAVASLSGVRFQSECALLADRSTQMQRMLTTLSSRANDVIDEIAADQQADKAGRGQTMDVLHFAEDCAKLTLDEVAEWSFIYAKEIHEP